MSSETAKVIPLTPEFRERMERGMLRVDREQYNNGYRCNPHIKFGHHKISYEIKPYKLIEKIDDNCYVVADPVNFNDD